MVQVEEGLGEVAAYNVAVAHSVSPKPYILDTEPKTLNPAWTLQNTPAATLNKFGKFQYVPAR